MKATRMSPARRRRQNLLVFGKPLIGEEEIAEVVDSLRSGWLGTGPKVARFEEMFRNYVGSRYAVAVNSCTAALHLAMLAAGIGPGDEVITTPMTFCATANAVLHAGATPVFVDVRRDTLNIDPDRLEGAITKHTKAILPVHFAGRPCDMKALLEVAHRYNLLVIEDAAHCTEGWYHGRKIGSIGHLTCFSFYATKNVATGEGGMVTTDHEEYATKIKTYALHGLSKDAWQRFSGGTSQHYQMLFPGFKYNMMDLQAALGIHQLARVEANLRRRAEIWTRYDEAFKGLPVVTPQPPEPDTVHARHLYTVLIDPAQLGKSRDQVSEELLACKIGTGIHYTALHLHPYYRERFGYTEGDFPNAEWIGERTLSLPLSAQLTDEDVEDVIAAVMEICSP